MDGQAGLALNTREDRLMIFAVARVGTHGVDFRRRARSFGPDLGHKIYEPQRVIHRSYLAPRRRSVRFVAELEPAEMDVIVSISYVLQEHFHRGRVPILYRRHPCSERAKQAWLEDGSRFRGGVALEFLQYGSVVSGV